MSVLLTIILVSFGVYYFYFSKKIENTVRIEDSEDIIRKLNENPDYLIQENLLAIKGYSLIEFLRQRYLYHKYEDPGKDPESSASEELIADFPGERGRVLVGILKTYIKFEREKDLLYKNTELDRYQKINKTEELRKEKFGIGLEKLLFPVKDSDIIDKFYAYTERYLKKHYTDIPRYKRIHLEKARREIYGDNFDRLFDKEPISSRIDLEMRIMERELGILNEKEKETAISEIRERVK